MMLTIKEVAEELRISLSLAYRLVANGEIPCCEFASCKRVDKEDLKVYIETQKRAPRQVPRGRGRHF